MSNPDEGARPAPDPRTPDQRAADFAAATDVGGGWLTVCSVCRRWVDGVWLVAPDGARYCRECAPPDPPKARPRIGPPCPAGAMCWCGRPAESRCDGCSRDFCGPCWWSHSHTHAGMMAAEAERMRGRQP